MNNKNSDIIEVFLKKDLDIPLTESEQRFFDDLDIETKTTVFELINNRSFIEELVNVVNNIKNKSWNLPVEEQQVINEKCETKIKKMENPNTNNSKMN